MREIIFRGNRKDNGESIFGYYFQKQNPFSADGFPITHYISDCPPFGAEVDPETVGQFTGLTDKNGKRIFEGDIIKRFWLGAEITYCVQYDGENTRFIGKAMNKRGFTTFDNDGEMFEIIGNIHDTPDLLEVHND